MSDERTVPGDIDRVKSAPLALEGEFAEVAAGVYPAAACGQVLVIRGQHLLDEETRVLHHTDNLSAMSDIKTWLPE